MKLNLKKDIEKKFIAMIKDTAEELRDVSGEVMKVKTLDDMPEDLIPRLEAAVQELYEVKGAITTLEIMEENPGEFFEVRPSERLRGPIKDMHIGEKGIFLIKEFESLKLKAYKCPAKVDTIGWGTTVYKDTGKKVKIGDQIDKDRADYLFKLDMVYFEDWVKKYVEVDLNQDEFDALVSIMYNVGPSKLNSTKQIFVKLNAGDYEGAAKEFKWWRSKGTPAEKGLTRRRFSERDLFLGKENYYHNKYENWMAAEYNEEPLK